MAKTYFLYSALGFILAILITHAVVKFRYERKIQGFKSIQKAVEDRKNRKELLEAEISSSKDELYKIKDETKDLQELRTTGEELLSSVEQLKNEKIRLRKRYRKRNVI